MYFYRPQTEKEKKQKKAMAKIYAFGATAVILIVITGGLYVIKYSGIFNIKKINVLGIQSVSSDEFISNLKDFINGNYKISSFLGTDNILSWKGESDFLEKYPQIESLDVNKNYFNREIDITVRERDKFGIWCFRVNNECYWFDRVGVIFGEAPMIETEILKRVNDFSNRNISVGEKALPENLLANLILIFGILDKNNINTKTIYLNNFDLEEVNTEAVARDPKIYFSLRFDPQFSVAAIEALKKSGKWNKISYIDFRVENRAYYK